MKSIVSLTLLFLFSVQSFAQVGIGTSTPHASAQLDVSSTSKGFLPPRVSLTATNTASPVTSPEAGLLVYNTATTGSAPNNVVPGYYYWNGTVWVNITGNGVPYTGAIGPVNLGAYDLTVNGLTVGAGKGAPRQNTAIGYSPLSSNTTGTNNVAIGFDALRVNTTGWYNTANGNYALRSNTTGDANTATGYASLANTESTTGNTANGYYALYANTTGWYNTADGFYALTSNTTGNSNTAIGIQSMYSNTTGGWNSALGNSALTSNVSGSYLTGLGHAADVSTDGLTNSTVIGYNARVSTSNTVAIGNGNVTSWVFGLATTTAGRALQVGSSNLNGNGAHLTTGGVWTNASSREFKEHFEDIDEEALLEKIINLSITKWKYKGTNETHIGPIAEDFKALFNLGVQDDDKHISTLDASGVALKAIQALYKKNMDLQQQIDELKLLLKNK